jgi:hypothetical protein
MIRSAGIPLFFLFCSMFFATSSVQAQKDGWVLSKETSGLKVYLRDAQNSNVKEVKIETTFDASMSTIVAVLKDVPAYPDWIYECISAKRMEASTQTSSTYYCKVDFPWPLDDRDFIAKSKLSQNKSNGRVYIEVKGLPDYMPNNDGVVRIEDLSINYEFIPLSNGKVKMNYELHSDPAGSIPSWLVNMVIDNGPINTIKGMRKMMEQPKYKNAQLSYLMY